MFCSAGRVVKVPPPKDFAEELAVISVGGMTNRNSAISHELVEDDLNRWWFEDGAKDEVMEYAKEGRVFCTVAYDAGKRGVMHTSPNLIRELLPAECRELLCSETISLTNMNLLQRQWSYTFKLSWKSQTTVLSKFLARAFADDRSAWLSDNDPNKKKSTTHADVMAAAGIVGLAQMHSKKRKMQ